MRLHVTPCENEKFSDNYLKVTFENKVLTLPNGDTIEVDCIFPKETITHSEGKFDTMFKDSNDELPEDDRKYFAKTTYWQKKKLNWVYGRNLFQKGEIIKFIITITLTIVSLIVLVLINWKAIKDTLGLK